MRPTWHFVSPTDIRWILALTGPRVNAGNASWYRSLELDEALFLRSNAIIVKALQGGKQLTRLELKSVLQRAGLAVDNLQRLAGIMMRAELDGIVCSGARRGKQFTYALLDERVPATRALDHDEALAELVRRYFTGHGPATLKDFVWWSGLSVADTRIGLEMNSTRLIHETIGSQTYWFANSPSSTDDPSPTAHLLANFDEYIVGYTDRSAAFDPIHASKLGARGDILSHSTLVLDGRVVGTWRRTLKKDAVTIVLQTFTPPHEAEISAFTSAASRYGAFLGLSVNIEFARFYE
jgi:hypothetical protein